MRDVCFAYITEVFSPVESKQLVATDEVTSSKTSSPSFPFETFFDAVTERELCEHSESSGWYCVPLHKLDRPVLRNEYVVFTDHPLRGKYVVLSSPNDAGDPITFRPEEFATLEIVEALRFWIHYSFPKVLLRPRNLLIRYRQISQTRGSTRRWVNKRRD